MYRVSKVLNNNGVIAIDMEENQDIIFSYIDISSWW